MLKFTQPGLSLALVTLMTACGSSSEPEGVIPEAQLNALDKANKVEDVLKDAQKKQLEKVDG